MISKLTHRTNFIWMCVVFVIALVPRLVVIVHYGPQMTLHSDDQGYYQSAVWLLDKGTYSFYTPLKPTVHMMPGIVLLLAGIIAVFGKGTLGLYVGKLTFAIIGSLGIVGAFRAIERIANRYVAFVVALALAFYPPSILVDSLFLTEPLFMAAFAWTVYYLLKLAETRKLSDLVALSVFFMLAMYLRPNVLLWAVVGLVYLLTKRYPTGLLARHGAMAIGIFIVFMLPWWIRNEIVFHQFIPLTDDSWNPFLLGTFQGEGFPPPQNEGAVEHQLLAQNPQLRPQKMHELQWFLAERHAAVYRIRLWYHKHPGEFWLSYLWLKPKIIWYKAYYPLRILGVHPALMKLVQHWLIWISLIGHAVAILFGKGRRLELLMVLLTLLYFTAIFSVFFAFERYNVPIEWLMLMGGPAGLWALIRAARGGRGRGRANKRPMAA
ncbi:glycosyltransferase family 39 protein [Alicyclobacillus acidiphilus]|uniref:glycosyltransferase family 39 protein n=1 Tax=Alicyclobacillus acidiphilus TaxID=182455 RepID=UPI00083681E5|nr:glycosyltransferase family 39 protein [Alicyclobacillus acidiphilus]